MAETEFVKPEIYEGVLSLKLRVVEAGIDRVYMTAKTYACYLQPPSPPPRSSHQLGRWRSHNMAHVALSRRSANGYDLPVAFLKVEA
jgi:hypothetical protein